MAQRRLLQISAKCSDLFFATAQIGDKTYEYDGYPLACVREDNTDMVDLTIDMDTGKIVGWDGPTDDEIIEKFKEIK